MLTSLELVNLRRRTHCTISLTSSKRIYIYFLTEIQSVSCQVVKQNGGRGAPNNGRAPSNGRGNGEPRLQSTAIITSRPSYGHHTTTSTDAIVNNLLGRDSKSSTSSSAQTPRVSTSNGNTTAPSDEHACTQAETLRLAQEADDNVLHEN